MPFEPGDWGGRKSWIWLMIGFVRDWGESRGGWAVEEPHSGPGGRTGPPCGGREGGLDYYPKNVWPTGGAGHRRAGLTSGGQ